MCLLLCRPNRGRLYWHLARLLSAELSSRHGLALHQESVAHIPTGRPFVLIGTFDNPLVREYRATHGLYVSAAQPGPEGYVLSVTSNEVVIAGSDERGAFYGLQSLRQLVESDSTGVHVPGVQIRDWPYFQNFGASNSICLGATMSASSSVSFAITWLSTSTTG